MQMIQKKPLIDRLPPDVQALVESTMAVLNLYMPGARRQITMCVGRDMEATLSFSGGPITQEVISDVLAHLAFYKKYFPKNAAPTPDLDSPEKILNAMVARWDDYQARLPRLETSSGRQETA